MNKDYTKISFHESENIKRYEEYAVSNPDMSADEIVWRVNNNLDKEKYNFDVEIQNPEGFHIIVNKYFKLSEDYIPPDLVEADGKLMRKAVRDA